MLGIDLDRADHGYHTNLRVANPGVRGLSQLVLRTDVAGMPLEWIDYKEAARLYTQEQVAYTCGSLIYPLYGGVNARTGLRTSAWPAVNASAEAYGWSGSRLKPAVPPAAAITRMDEALGWIRLIPQENYVLRRIVGARALVSPLTGRHLFSWRKLGTLIGADGRAVQRWHAKGIAMIVALLNGETEKW